MILLVCSDKNTVSDFIMLADIEFVMQLEALEGNGFGNQLFTIIDMTELGRIRQMRTNETLYLVSHGNNTHAILGTEKYEWNALGQLIGTNLPPSMAGVEVLACNAATAPSSGKTGIRKFADGIGQHQHGVPVRGYKGATVTNTAATVTTREVGGSNGPVLVIDGSTEWYEKGQKPLLTQYDNEIQQFKSWCASNKGATLQDKAIVAAAMTWTFYAAYATEFVGKKYFYQKQHDSLVKEIVFS
jgi:hypothetical protein